MKTTLASLAFAAVTAIAALPAMSSAAMADCVSGRCWGAVAYGPSTSTWVVNYATQSSARHRALAKCPSCKYVLTLRNTCGAYVAGNGGHGWATSRNKPQAIGAAMAQCSRVAKNCTLRVWACTSR